MANTDRRAGTRIQDIYSADSSAGIVARSGIYIGVVKSAQDPTRSGRLSVWISAFGAEEDDPKGWVTVLYASPFAGTTRTPGPRDSKNTQNDFTGSEQSYGMWFVPPDIDNKVLCSFVSGDSGQGYWFACIIDSIQHHMIPNIPGSRNSAGLGSSFGTVKSQISVIGPDANLPITEFNRYNQNFINPFITQDKRPVHPYQAQRYIEQGLDRDPIRGPSGGSSQRESPSGIFGISTPGRPIADPKDSQLNNRDRQQDFTVYGRKGGHVFIMDDGDNVGNDQQIRLRTSTGHQILMDDNTGVFSIHQANGSSWIELSPSGHISVYAQAGLNVRTQGGMNFHSDTDIKFFAAGEIKMKAEKALRMEAEQTHVSGLQTVISASNKLELISKQGQLNIDANMSVGIRTSGQIKIKSSDTISINQGIPPLALKPPRGLTMYSHADVEPNALGVWQVRQNMIKRTIANIVPTHEPWNRASGIREDPVIAGADPIDLTLVDINDPVPGAIVIYEGSGNTALQGGGKLSAGRIAQITLSDGTYIRFSISDTDLDAAPSRFGINKTFGELDQTGVNALAAFLFRIESGNNYENVTNPSYMGGFQFGVEALETVGYLKPGTYKTYGSKAFLDVGLGGQGAAVWTGKGGIGDLSAFLNSPSMQIQAVVELMQVNYKYGLSTGAINTASSPAEVGGYLAGAHLIGLGAASNYMLYGENSPSRKADGNNTHYLEYFNSAGDAINRSIAKASNNARVDTFSADR